MDETASLTGWSIAMTKDGQLVNLNGGQFWGTDPTFVQEAVEAMADGLRLGGFEVEVTYTFESKVRS